MPNFGQIRTYTDTSDGQNRLRDVIARLDPGASGKQIDYRGREVPW